MRGACGIRRGAELCGRSGRRRSAWRMNALVWQIVVAVATILVVFLRWQFCCRHHRGAQRRVLVREQRPPLPYTNRVGVRRHYRGQVMATRTVALSTLPIPIKGTIEPVSPGRHARVETASPLRASDIRFAPPDIALMRRVVEGLRALPSSPGDTPPRP